MPRRTSLACCLHYTRAPAIRLALSTRGMPSSDEQSLRESSFQKFYSLLSHNLSFYRLHILYFTFTPLIFSGIFYASNGRFHIAYIDALFNSVSAMAVCGLTSVDLSSLTAWQQTILFVQMCLGNPVVVSWFVVFIRRRMFTIYCESIVQAATRKAAPEYPNTGFAEPTLTSRLASSIHAGANRLSLDPFEAKSGDSQRKRSRKLHPDMIRRVDGAPKLVNPSGSVIEGQASTVKVHPDTDNLELSVPTGPHARQLSLVQESRSTSPTQIPSTSSGFHAGRSARRHSESNHSPNLGDKAQTASSDRNQRPRGLSLGTPSNVDTDRRTYDHPIQRTQTIEFAPSPQPRHRASRDKSRLPDSTSEMAPGHLVTEVFPTELEYSDQPGVNYPLRRTETMRTFRSSATRHDHFGGFPGAQHIISQLVNRFFPGVHRQLRRTVTMPRTTTITSIRGNNRSARAVPYISFDAVVRHNSAFQSLTDEQLEELGGVEFRALTALLWIVGVYHISAQLFAFTIIAPYISTDKWKTNFLPPQQHRPIVPAWFSLFQVVTAYTNAGMSLVDQSMIPFQRAYPMIFAMMFVIFAGNTAFLMGIPQPIFLRFSVWILTKLVPRNSQLYETLHFLLDHPRRCFIYLFPSHQTWFLLTVLIIMTTTDWFFFLILDLGNAVIGSIPVGVRVIDGLFQATAVRAAGFAIVSISALAPGVKVLYVIMMYISIYPIAMSVRSTNVYEERSLGIYEDDSSVDEEGLRLSGDRMTVWGNYLATHARKQLAFDMWWLGLALFLVCIIERDQLENPENATWFNIFNIIFELVSAYGGVGLSIGLPYFLRQTESGELLLFWRFPPPFQTYRRHRGLPVAIDRAVLLPFEYRQLPDNDTLQPSGPARRRRPSSRTVLTTSSNGVR
ncbi:cation transport protein-domain-containing protein [Lactarius vividus]|nr:cation transport protein-domain-containing protein [Lactarius vividus]